MCILQGDQVENRDGSAFL